MSSIVGLESILSLIDVQPPYYALQNLFIDDHHAAYASIEVEQSLGKEAGPISSGEIGRHLAILGSCSVASLNPVKSKHYYLASKAVLRRNPAVRQGGTATRHKLYGVAAGKMISGKSAAASCYIQDHTGHILYYLEVMYHVVKEETFKRANRKFQMQNIFHDASPNPYKHLLPLRNIEKSIPLVKAELGMIEPAWCYGHFAELPVLPIARLMSQLIQTAGIHAAHLHGDDEITFQVLSGNAQADQLAFAGDHIQVQSELTYARDEIYWFDCKAVSNGSKVVGQVYVELKVMPAAALTSSAYEQDKLLLHS
ncbi:hypothetical protein ACFFK0_07320 [Paenibacillus chartarius]|uniref:Uncharacterized protein n=1 Tax=Paenibacillus chartarius TaxID=747481 RepID=A0ABV6DHZ7_9BACL